METIHLILKILLHRKMRICPFRSLKNNSCLFFIKLFHTNKR